MKKTSITITDIVCYEFDSNEYTQEEAVEKALEWWDERKPNISITVQEYEDSPKEVCK